MSEREPQQQSWYLARDGRQFGPYAGDEILRLAEAGMLRADDLIWRPGLAGWRPLHAVSGLITPPPAPRFPTVLAGLIARPAPLPPPLPPQPSRQQSLPPLPEPGQGVPEAARAETPPPQGAATKPVAGAAGGSQPQEGSAERWIETMPLRWTRNGAIAGAILGLPYIAIDTDGVYLLVIAAALMSAVAAVAAFFARDRLRRFRPYDGSAAAAVIDALPARYAAWGAGLGAIGAVVALGFVVPSRTETNAAAIQTALLFSGAIAASGFAFFLAGLVLSRNIRKRRLQAGGASASVQPRWQNFIAKHWRGELSLPVSYWVIGFAGNLAAYASMWGLAALFMGDDRYYPLAVFVGIVAIWTAITGITVWQIVGVWRSARRYRHERIGAGKPAFWGGVAQALTCLWALQLAASLSYAGLPQVAEVSRMAFLDDPEMGPYAFRIMRNGTEVEITGGIKYGLTEDFLRVFTASPQISIVHLDSPGGRIGEALALHKAIKERGLITYVSNECQSACAVVFAAGRERWLKSGAILGFHAGYFPGMSKSDLASSDTDQKRIYLEAGFDPEFVERAVSTPNDDMLTPSADELVKAKVVSAISDGSEFAASGYGAQLSKEALAERLVEGWPVLEAMKERLPQDYNAIVDDWYGGYVKGKTEVEILDAFWYTLFNVAVAYMKDADDDVLIDYAVLTAEEYALWGKKDPALCYRYASGTDRTGSFYHYLPEALQKREIDIYKRIVETMDTRPRIAKAEISRIYAKLRKTIADERMALALAKDVPPEKYQDYCRAWADLNQEVAGLRENEAAALLRDMAGGNEESEPTAAVPDAAAKKADGGTKPNPGVLLLAEIETRFPQDFGELTKNWDQDTISKMTTKQFVDSFGPKLQRFVRGKIVLADDDVLVDFGGLLADQLTALGAKDATLCFKYVSGQEAEVYGAMPKKLIDREVAIYRRVIATAADRPELTEEEKDALLKKIVRKVPRDDMLLLLADHVPQERYGDACLVATKVYRSAAAFGKHEGASLVRLMWEALKRPAD